MSLELDPLKKVSSNGMKMYVKIPKLCAILIERYVCCWAIIIHSMDSKKTNRFVKRLLGKRLTFGSWATRKKKKEKKIKRKRASHCVDRFFDRIKGLTYNSSRIGTFLSLSFLFSFEPKRQTHKRNYSLFFFCLSLSVIIIFLVTPKFKRSI